MRSVCLCAVRDDRCANHLERASPTVNRPTKPGRLRSRQHAATSTVMRATNPDRYQPQNMWMSSFTKQRTPTRKEKGNTDITRNTDVRQSM